MTTHAHLFIEKAVKLLWENAGHTTPLSIRTSSRVPSAAGLGSSAALSTATCAGLLHLTGQLSETRLARASYETEWLGQGGRGSPIDTSTATHGRGIFISREKGEAHLWTITRGERVWHIHDQTVPPLPLVVAHSGEKGKTADIVAKVAMYYERTDFAEAIVRDIGTLTLAGREALLKEDYKQLGLLMNECHELLGMLGVSTKRLDELCRVARDHAYGAKLTGAGAGGCMVAITDDPEGCKEALETARAEAWIVRPARKGARAWGRAVAGRGPPDHRDEEEPERGG
jgi:mevalonate kinase